MLFDNEALLFQSYPPLKKKKRGREDLYKTAYVNQRIAVLI